MWQKLEREFDHHTWNQFVKKYGPLSGRFLQSWEWGEFQKAMGERVERWVWEEEVGGRRQKAVANAVMKNLRGFGTYAYCPRGPVVVEESLFPELVEGITTVIGPILFFRFDPPIPFLVTHPHSSIFPTHSVQPAQTWVTDLQSSSDQILASMHSKTRYNMHLAERHRVQIAFDTHMLDDVWPLFEKTSGRGKFRLHEKQHYKKLLETLKEKDCCAHLVTAVHQDKPIAANIMVDFAGVRTYLHGASSYEHRSLMAPYLLHWILIKDAIAQGMTHYDWWGVGPTNISNHPWAGISRFKRSFPGQEIEYPGTYDLVRKPLWYKVYQYARHLRRLV